jgi:nucleotide-binding universal stress UspA family protein
MLEPHLERRQPMFRTILLAVDGSKHSGNAVELARRLAMATSADRALRWRKQWTRHR